MDGAVILDLSERMVTPHLISFTAELRQDSSIQGALTHVAEKNPQLLEVEVISAFALATGWTNVLRALPNLTRLRIASSSLISTSLSALSEVGFIPHESAASDGTSGPTYACPKLEELVLENELSLTSRQVREIVTARCTAPSLRIRTVTMRGVDGDLMDEDDIAAILDLVDHFVLEVIDVEGVVRDVAERNDSTYDNDSFSSDSDDSAGSWTSGDRYVVEQETSWFI